MKWFFVSFLLISVIFYTSFLNAQSFTTSPYVTILGNNSQIDVVSGSFIINTPLAFICWINQSDSVYNIYLRQTSPDTSKNILIFSDTNQIANPKIAFIDYSSNIRIVWQSYINNHWQILSREIINDTLGNVVPMTDSLNDNIMPALGSQILAWIQNGNLLVRFLDSAKTSIITLDSVNCSNPDIAWAYYGLLSIAYEKGLGGNKQVYTASYQSYPKPIWTITKISDGVNNLNPRYGIMIGTLQVTYQTYSKGVWKVITPFINNDTTNNITYNCENAFPFLYFIVTKPLSGQTPPFVVYDSDSLLSNREVIYKPVSGWYYPDTAKNLSNSSGDDYKPLISFYHTDTTYIVVFWTHEENGKKDIWMAKSIFNPVIGAVNEPPQSISNFSLEQNYPNPFNPVTTISYTVAAKDFVTIKVFDLLGKEVATLVNKEKPAGSYSVDFNASKLSSGVYFYRMKAGSFVETKKLILMK